jgi:hypothetical protein
MLKARVIPALMIAGLFGVPSPASAQNGQQDLTTLLLTQFVQNVVLARTAGGAGLVAHSPSFQNDPRLGASVVNISNVVNQLSTQIGSQLSALPVGSSSGGFTYRYDAATGTYTRSTETFGPAFAERAETLGRSRVNLGMSYTHSSYSELDGRSLEGGDIKFYLPHEALTPRSFVEGDVLEASLRLNLSSDTTVFFVTAGLLENLDVGIAVPFQRVSMDLTYRATVLDFATRNSAPNLHVFANNSKTADFSTSESASGVGDVLVRAKYNFHRSAGKAFAAGLDVRMPTGDEKNMLGNRAAQTQVYLISSMSAGRVGPHFNVGFTKAGSDGADQFNYVAGAEMAASPRLTIVGDVIGRTFIDTFRLENDVITHPYRQADTAPEEVVSLNTVRARRGNVNSVLGAIGVKFNPVSNILINGHLIFTITDAGLRRNLTPVLGFDFSF